MRTLVSADIMYGSCMASSWEPTCHIAACTGRRSGDPKCKGKSMKPSFDVRFALCGFGGFLPNAPSTIVKTSVLSFVFPYLLSVDQITTHHQSASCVTKTKPSITPIANNNAKDPPNNHYDLLTSKNTKSRLQF